MSKKKIAIHTVTNSVSSVTETPDQRKQRVHEEGGRYRPRVIPCKRGKKLEEARRREEKY